MKERLKSILCVVIVPTIIAICISFLFVFIEHSMTEKKAEEIVSQITEVFDEVDKDMAVKTLAELRGRILEIKYLSFNHNIETYILQDELDDIIRGIDSNTYWDDNPYLKDFEFIVHDTSTVREFCEDLISQIDQISIIE